MQNEYSFYGFLLFYHLNPASSEPCDFFTFVYCYGKVFLLITFSLHSEEITKKLSKEKVCTLF